MNWINTKEQLPKPYEMVVMVINEDGEQQSSPAKMTIVHGWLDRVIDTPDGFEYRFIDSTNYKQHGEQVTHWMKAPEPPEEFHKSA